MAQKKKIKLEVCRDEMPETGDKPKKALRAKVPFLGYISGLD
jgi:hypothetical protein